MTTNYPSLQSMNGWVVLVKKAYPLLRQVLERIHSTACANLFGLMAFLYTIFFCFACFVEIIIVLRSKKHAHNEKQKN